MRHSRTGGLRRRYAPRGVSATRLDRTGPKMPHARMTETMTSIDDVQQGRFPGPEHVIDAPDGLIGAFVDAVDGSG